MNINMNISRTKKYINIKQYINMFQVYLKPEYKTGFEHDNKHRFYKNIP